MDSSAVNQNVTVDDFDSIVTYAEQSQWTTPDPTKSLPFNQSSTPWRAGTYHRTSATNASFTFKFEGGLASRFFRKARIFKLTHTSRSLKDPHYLYMVPLGRSMALTKYPSMAAAMSQLHMPHLTQLVTFYSAPHLLHTTIIPLK